MRFPPAFEAITISSSGITRMFCPNRPLNKTEPGRAHSQH